MKFGPAKRGFSVCFEGIFCVFQGFFSVYFEWIFCVFQEDFLWVSQWACCSRTSVDKISPTNATPMIKVVKMNCISEQDFEVG